MHRMGGEDTCSLHVSSTSLGAAILILILILILIYRQLTLAEEDSHEHALKT